MAPLTDPKHWLPSGKEAMNFLIEPNYATFKMSQRQFKEVKSSLKPEETPPPVSPLKESSPEVQEAARKEAERLRRLKGSASTILTSPLGVQGPPTAVKRKLGE